MKRVLFISGSIGLGHVNRDLAIASELSRQLPDVDITWLASQPAKSVIKEAGGRFDPQIENYGNDTTAAQKASGGEMLNLYKYVMNAVLFSNEWRKNVDVLKQIIRKGDIDLVIGDETYEIIIALLKKTLNLKIPFVIIYDFLGLDAMTRSPIEAIAVYMINALWANDHKVIKRNRNLALFVGEPDDVLDRGFGPFLGKRRDHANKYYHFIGYILPFDPNEYTDIGQLRRRLGYGDGKLVICSIGGVGVGKELLEICSKAFPIIKERVPGLHMLLIGGPGTDISKLTAQPGMEVKQYVPALYEHFAACDLAIVQAGGTTTLELTALCRPFIYVPQENQCEQNFTVCGRLERHRAGIRMNIRDMSPESLADTVTANLGKAVNYADVPVDGAKRAAKLISDVLRGFQQE